MKKVIIWIESGDESLWLAKAIAGAFANRIFLDCEKLEAECLTQVLPQIIGQSGAFVGIHKSPISMQKRWGGIVLLPYGSRVVKEAKDVIVHVRSDKKNEKDLAVERLLEYMRINKILKAK